MKHMAHTTYEASSEQSRRLRKAAGSWLANRRKDKDLTQRALADLVGLDYYTFISQLECGVGRVPPHLYIPFADALGMKRAVFTREMLKYYDPFTYQGLYGDDPYEMDFDTDKEVNGE